MWSTAASRNSVNGKLTALRVVNRNEARFRPGINEPHQPSRPARMATTQTFRQRPLIRQHDRRRFQRVTVNLLGRFMLEDRREYPCQTVDMSPGSLAVTAAVIGRVGERVVAYIDQVGRIEGQIVRVDASGFAMSITATARKRDKLAAKLTWLANRHELNLPEDRRHDRISAKISVVPVTLPDGREYQARVVDISLSGAALGLDVRPPIGSPVMIGKLRARIVRHFDEGVAIEFATQQTVASLEQNLAMPDAEASPA
jgi:c-di-GMP-binding flagellar brake protein YcgR